MKELALNPTRVDHTISWATVVGKGRFHETRFLRSLGCMSSIVGGKLTLKGGLSLAPKSDKKSGKKKDKKSKKSKKSKSDGKKKRSRDDDSSAASGASSSSSSYAPKLVRGTGRLITSGTTVHGKETSFHHELDAGDAVEVVHPTTMVPERRLVTMVLSDVSMALSSAFSSDLVSSTPFSYIE